MLIAKLVDEYFEQMVPLCAEQRHIMAMLLERESQAAEVRAKLESGEEFGELAGELSLESLSKAGNGDLGWHPKDVLAELLATSIPGEYAFGSDVGVLSQPVYDETITTSMGYWLLRVLDKDDNREISDDDRDLLKAMALNEWVSSLWDNPENDFDDSYLDDEKKAWAIVKAIGG